MLPCLTALPQPAAFPLESIAVKGSAIPDAVILDMAAFRIGAPIDKAGIDEACYKLQASGLFASVSYRYGSGPNQGYAVTLTLADQADLVPANIDVPAVDENEVWRWLSARFRRFDREVPQEEAAQRYLAREIETRLGNRMRGQHLTVRRETDPASGDPVVSFQPEDLPRVLSVTFAGNQAVPSPELAAALSPVLSNAGYTARTFAATIEQNLRPVYEEHAYYRVRFAPGEPEWREGGVAVPVSIQEGAPYTLGKMEVEGAELPAAAVLPAGMPANSKQIQAGILDIEKAVKRTGFFEAAASAERSLDDAAHVVNVRVRIAKGPLYRFGQIRITGLPPDLDVLARGLWKPKTGDPYDYAYPYEFYQTFSQSADLSAFRNFYARTHRNGHVMDLELVFEPR